jgi:hypothetical protein
MGGLDPPIHPASVRERKDSSTRNARLMNGRVKSAHDGDRRN